MVATAHVYNYTSVRYFKWRTSQEIFLGNKPKKLYFYVSGYEAYVFLPSVVCPNKLVPYSKLIIFIGYEDNSYHFIYYKQGNIIFHSTHVIFDEGLFPKCIKFYAKEHKLYDKLLDKISPEIESSTSNLLWS